MNLTTAKGTVLKISSFASPHTQGAIGQCRSFAGPTVKPKVQDITTHDTAGFWARTIATQVTAGTISFPINFDSDDATHAWDTGLWASMVALLRSSLTMIFPNSAGYLTFDGFVAQHDFAAPVDNVLSAAIQIAITDAVTGHTGSPA